MTFTRSSSSKKNLSDGDNLVTKSKFTQFLNYLFCRGDLAKQKLTAQPVPLKLLFRYSTRADHILLFIGVIAASLSGMTQPFLAILAGRFFNTLLLTPPESDQFVYEATLYTSLYLGSFFVCVAINLTQFLCFQRVCARQIARIRHEFVRSILRQEAGWFDSTSCGTLTTQLNDNVERIRDGIGDKLGLLIRGFVMFVASLGVSLFFEWRVALFMAPVAPLTCACMNLMNRKIAKATSKELSNIGNAGSVAEEAILGVRTVQSLNGQEEMVSRYESELSKGMEYAASKAIWSGFLGGVFFFLLFFFMAGGMLLGGHLLKEGIIQSGGDIMTAVLSMLISAYFLGMISPQLVVILNSRVAAAVIYKTIDRVPTIDAYEETGQVLPEVVGEVEFRNCCFRYPSRKDVIVLDGFCLKVATGKTLALVGHSGSGKSTAIGLLSRLYEVESGNVFIDGVDVREIRLSCLRKIIGVVEQQPALFNDTIKENIRLGREDISDEDMKRVCRMANAHEFISKLPKGYDTIIGDGGVQLSGGQKQRVAIARTLSRNPKILLLDEATSALDGHSETVVQQALENAMKDRTTIVIAHRLATVVKADMIVVMEKGKIVETGVHKDLMAAGGKYAALAKAQLMNKVEVRPRQISTTEISGPDAFRRGVSAESSIRGSFMSTGDIECFSDDRAPEEEKVDKNAAGIIDLYKEAGAFRTSLIGAFFAAVLRGLEMPVNTISWGILLAAFKDVNDPDMMVHVRLAVFLMLANGVIMCVAQTIGTSLFGKVAEKLILSLRVRAFRNVLHQDAAFFDMPEHSPGKIITRLATDGPNTKAAVDSRMFHVAYYCSAWAISLGVSTYNCWPLGLVGFFLSVFLFWFLTRLAKKIQKRNVRMSKHNPAGKLSVEIVENVRTIQLLTREERFFEKYREASHALKHTEVKNGYLDAINFGVSQSYIFFSIGIAYGLCAYFIRRGYFPIVEAYEGMLASFLASICTMLASAFYSEFTKAQTAIGLVFKMIRRETATGDVEKGDKPILNGDIEFDEVHFVYPQRSLHPVMKGLSLSVKRGQTIALVGPSGSGKSTIISMLERFYDTTLGTVKFDGHELKKLSLRHLRTQMSLVGQEPRLFSGSIKENVCFGMGNVDDARIRKALDMANASNFVFALPQGLDTEVGEKGTQLSGGQKQRVAIARALIREPVVLLLDEATSALDSQAEKAVQEALEVARKGRTVVAVAHRLSSIQNADEILFISDGKVRERGTHEDLMRQRGHYYELVLKQDLERNRDDD